MKRAFTDFKRNVNVLFKCKEVYENENKNLDINSEKSFLRNNLNNFEISHNFELISMRKDIIGFKKHELHESKSLN